MAEFLGEEYDVGWAVVIADLSPERPERWKPAWTNLSPMTSCGAWRTFSWRGRAVVFDTRALAARHAGTGRRVARWAERRA